MTRIHVVSLPHTLLTRDYDWCAYTAKVRRFITMVHGGGNTAIVYGPDVHEVVQCEEYVPVVHESDRLAWFGAPEWDKDQVFDRWDAADVAWTTMNHRAAVAIRERWQDGDILGLIGGLCQVQIISELADLNPLTTEWGIGYSGVIEGTHKVFESYAWMHHVAARRPSDEMQFFDAVIPNCFDERDFIFSADLGDYLLYLGRPNPRKGLPIIAEIAARTDLRVVIAGQPGPAIPGTDYVGMVLGDEKAKLLAGARAVLTPTTYLEPFGGVAVEAMLSGTPVIASDYGAFTETVVQEVSGFRCRMLSEFLDAVEEVEYLDRTVIRDLALSRYGLPTGIRLYAQYLARLETLYGDGWYAADPR
jgi:glycosyltransferase involved in cell wall biosynthesis